MTETSVDEPLDPELLAEACLLSEIELQCVLAIYHYGQIRENARLARDATTAGPGGRSDFTKMEYHKIIAFGEVQALLTCASIVDSIVTGRGPPPPKNIRPISRQTRNEIQRRLKLPADFAVPGRPQRNGLVHIAERILPWSQPGNVRGDLLTGIAPETTQAQLSQVLRALDFDTLKFAVLGEGCDLTEVGQSLIKLHSSAREAQDRILSELESKSQQVSGAGPN